MFCAGTICMACYVEVFFRSIKSIDVLNGGIPDAVVRMYFLIHGEG